MYFLLGFTEAIGQGFEKGLRALLFMISTVFYQLVIFFYDIFVRLGTAELLTTSQIQSIFSRITLILGIFMLFKMLFSFVQYLINPDSMNDKNKGLGKIVTRAVIVVALLGFTPFIFQQAYKLQKMILDSNIIGKVILASNTANSDVSEFGSDLSSYMFFSFYSFYEGETCEYGTIEDMQDEIRYNHSFNVAKACLNEKPSNESHDYVVNYAGNGILSLVVSVFVLYIILSYCLSVGMRVIQLAFLQLISPIPIMSYLGEDKDGAFSKWLKRCLSTFLDLFIRIAIIYFVVYIIDLLMSESNSYYLLLSTTGNPTGSTKTWLIIILILGLLMFAKKAPDLLKEVLPSGIGNNIGFGLDFAKNVKSAGDTVRKVTRPVGRGVGFVGGGLTGATVSSIARFNTNRRAGNGMRKSLFGAAGGFVSGMATGAMTGGKKGNVFKNIGASVKGRTTADNKYNELINSDGDTFGKFTSKVTDVFGETKGQRYTRFINNAKTVGSYRDDAYKAAEKISAVSAAKEALGHIQQEVGETSEQFRRRQSRTSNSVDNMTDAAFNAAADGKKYYSWLEERSFKLSDVADPRKKFSFDVSSFNTGNSLQDFSAAKTSFEASLNAQIADYGKNGGNVNSIDKSAIMKAFNDNWINSNGTSTFSYEIGSISDYKAAAKTKFEESLRSQLKLFEYDVNNNSEIPDSDKQKLIKGMNENLQVQLNQFDNDWDRAISTGIGEIEYKIDSIAKFSSSDDRRIAQVQSGMAQAESYVKATGAEYYDRSDGQWKEFKFDNGEDFRSAGKKRDNTISHITSQNDYQSAIANDKAAGVDSNASSKK